MRSNPAHIKNTPHPHSHLRAIPRSLRTYGLLLGMLGVSTVAIANDSPPPQLAGMSLWDMPIEALMDIEVESIASGSRTPVHKSASIVSVMTAEQIHALGFQTLDEVLTTLPGVHVNHADQTYFPLYVVRGITSRFNPHTLLMINGVPVKTLFTGTRHHMWGMLPVKAIARIEVIRGPGSALHGADAFAGTINIITKTAKDMPYPEAGYYAGSFDTWGSWFQGGQDGDELAWSFSLEHRESGGQRETVAADAQTLFDQLIGTDASLAPGRVYTMRDTSVAQFDFTWGNWHYQLNAQQDDNLGLAVGIAQALDPQGRYQSNRVMNNVIHTWQSPDERWQSRVLLSHYYSTQEASALPQLFPPGANLGSGAFPEGMIGAPGYKEEQWRAQWSLSFQLHASRIVRIGAGYDSADIYEVSEPKNFTVDFAPRPDGLTDVGDELSQVFLPRTTLRSRYAFVQDEWRMAPHWALTTGVRYDRFDSFGDTLNPRVGLVWDTTETLTTRLLYGRAFRAPAAVELYAVSNPVTLGNPDLKPETLDSVELAFTKQFTNALSSSLNAFYYHIDNFIDYQPGGDGTPGLFASNQGERRGHGLEWEARWTVSPQLRWHANYSLQHSVDESTGQRIANAPRHQAYLRTVWQPVDEWQLGTSIRWVGSQPREANDPRAALAAYHVVNLTLTRLNIVQRGTLRLHISNLFNERVLSPSPGPASPPPVAFIPGDFPQARRAVFGEVAWRF